MRFFIPLLLICWLLPAATGAQKPRKPRSLPPVDSVSNWHLGTDSLAAPGSRWPDTTTRNKR